MRTLLGVLCCRECEEALALAEGAQPLARVHSMAVPYGSPPHICAWRYLATLLATVAGKLWGAMPAAEASLI